MFTIEYIDNEDGTATINLSTTKDKVKIDNFALDAAKHFYHRWAELDADDIKIPFEDLTKDQKLNILAKEISEHLIRAAKTEFMNDNLNDATAAANTEIETRY